MTKYFKGNSTAEYLTILKQLEHLGYKWNSGNKPTELLRYFSTEFIYLVIDTEYKSLCKGCVLIGDATPWQLKDDLEE